MLVVRAEGSGKNILFYGHLDKQPAEEFLWNEHKPYEPVEKDSRLYGRGSCEGVVSFVYGVLLLQEL